MTECSPHVAVNIMSTAACADVSMSNTDAYTAVQLANMCFLTPTVLTRPTSRRWPCQHLSSPLFTRHATTKLPTPTHRLSPSASMDPSLRDSLFPSAKVFCNSNFLNLLQTSPHRPFQDSKSLVDLELRYDPEQVLAAFSNLPPNPSKDQYIRFLNYSFKHTDPDSHSLVRFAKPADYTDQIPSRMVSLAASHPHLLAFVLDLKKRWADLCRSFPPELVPTHATSAVTSRSSLIPLPYPFFVPGGRFRECYYWDTLWIVKGLISCDMIQSAQNAVRNLLYLVQLLGFVPNGNRVYYLNRSQPPTLTEAVLVVFDALPNNTERITWLQEALPILDKEYDNFTKTHSLSSVHPGSPLMKELFSLYTVDTSDPRPESFKEDLVTLNEKLRRAPNEKEMKDLRARLFQDLASGAESGWDYSSRFFTEHGKDLEDIRTQDVVPCCLNSILFKAETELSRFHDFLGLTYTVMSETSLPEGQIEDAIASHAKMRDRYNDLAKQRQQSIMHHMWNAKEAFWFDLDATNAEQTETVSCAGLMPAWAGCWEGHWTASDARRFVDFVMNSSGLLRAGGLACTTTSSEQQWDSPNCWPPLVDFAMTGMQCIAAKFPESGAAEAAEEIAKRFVRVTYGGWVRDRQMHEKYDSRSDAGERGAGGEYVPQTGFGWTNGTVLWVLQEYADLISETQDRSWA